MEIRVNTDNMRSTATVFQEKINDWNSLVQQLWSLMEELDAMWDGDANEAFKASVNHVSNFTSVAASGKSKIDASIASFIEALGE